MIPTRMLLKHSIMRSPQENPKTKARRKLPLHSAFVFGLLVSLLPASSSSADVIELSQSQLRHLVSEEQIQGAEVVVNAAVRTFGGTPIDIRGFLSDGRMTYRLLMQHSDGGVIEVLMNGQTAQCVSHTSVIGSAVASQAFAKTASSRGRTSTDGSQDNVGPAIDYRVSADQQC